MYLRKIPVISGNFRLGTGIFRLCRLELGWLEEDIEHIAQRVQNSEVCQHQYSQHEHYQEEIEIAEQIDGGGYIDNYKPQHHQDQVQGAYQHNRN